MISYIGISPGNIGAVWVNIKGTNLYKNKLNTKNLKLKTFTLTKEQILKDVNNNYLQEIKT